MKGIPPSIVSISFRSLGLGIGDGTGEVSGGVGPADGPSASPPAVPGAPMAGATTRSEESGSLPAVPGAPPEVPAAPLGMKMLSKFKSMASSSSASSSLCPVSIALNSPEMGILSVPAKSFRNLSFSSLLLFSHCVFAASLATMTPWIRRNWASKRFLMSLCSSECRGHRCRSSKVRFLSAHNSSYFPACAKTRKEHVAK